jgi:hypothetical protein
MVFDNVSRLGKGYVSEVPYRIPPTGVMGSGNASNSGTSGSGHNNNASGDGDLASTFVRAASMAHDVFLQQQSELDGSSQPKTHLRQHHQMLLLRHHLGYVYSRNVNGLETFFQIPVTKEAVSSLSYQDIVAQIDPVCRAVLQIDDVTLL